MKPDYDARELNERTEKLIHLDRLAAMPYPRVLRWAGADEARLRLVAQARGYRLGWVWHRLRELGEPSEGSP